MTIDMSAKIGGPVIGAGSLASCWCLSQPRLISTALLIYVARYVFNRYVKISATHLDWVHSRSVLLI